MSTKTKLVALWTGDGYQVHPEAIPRPKKEPAEGDLERAYQYSRGSSLGPGVDEKALRFEADHWPGDRAIHIWTVSPVQVKKGRFVGAVQVMERFDLPWWAFPACAGVDQVTYPGLAEVYRERHDVWCVGPDQFTCGSHGEHCHAVEVVKIWLGEGKTTIIYHPYVTWDGRVIECFRAIASPTISLWLRIE